jgi:phosphoribosylaminoimidazole-succinocarboxamide synthase
MTTTHTPATTHPVTTTDLNLPGRRSGKVRDIYQLPPAPGTESTQSSLERLAIIATDRISAFDIVLPTALPGKGQLLTKLSVWWLKFIAEQSLCKTHLLSTDPDDLPTSAFEGATTRPSDLVGRLMIGRRCEVVLIECVVRGYLEGSGWKDYQRDGAICGIKLPAGLKQCDRLPEPIFTPTTKAQPPLHDEAVTFERACEVAGTGLMETLRERSLAIYSAASAYALERGIIIADTKFEFGLPLGPDGKVSSNDPILIDEALTPDSSRFWPAASYEPGHAQPSFDKQFVREYLQSLVEAKTWNKTDPGPALPDEIVDKTLSKYREAFDLLTG